MNRLTVLFFLLLASFGVTGSNLFGQKKPKWKGENVSWPPPFKDAPVPEDEVPIDDYWWVLVLVGSALAYYHLSPKEDKEQALS